MKNYTWVLLAVAALASAGCLGKKDETTTAATTTAYSGSLGKCVIPNTFCYDWSYSGTLSADPSTEAKTAAEKACTDSSGTFTAGGTCTDTSAIGYCKITSAQTGTSGSYTISGIIVFLPGDMSGAMNSTVAQTSCTNAGGTYSTTRPN